MATRNLTSDNNDLRVKYRRIVLSYLHSYGIEGSTVETINSVVIDYDLPSSWSKSKTSKIENKLNVKLKSHGL